LAQSGRLTQARFEVDAEAILGIAKWAATHGQWPQLLELVRFAETSVSLTQHAQEFKPLLEHARDAAEKLGDRQAEIWALTRMAALSEVIGEPRRAAEYERRAADLLGTLTKHDRRGWLVGLPNSVRVAIAVVVALPGGGIGYALGGTHTPT